MVEREFNHTVTRAHPNRSTCGPTEAWHVINATDPLEDSDKEEDEHVRLEYSTSPFRVPAAVNTLCFTDHSIIMFAHTHTILVSLDRRLRVLARLRGKEPTPEPEPQPQQQPRPPQPPPGGQGEPSTSTGRLQQVQSWR